MAALTYADILDPVGKVLPSMFPSDTTAALQDRLTGWLTEAYAKPEVVAITDDAVKNDAARAWVYYRAFDSVANRMMLTASKVSLTDQGSQEFTNQQLAYFVSLRNSAFEDFSGMIVVTTSRTSPSDGGYLSNSFSW